MKLQDFDHYYCINLKTREDRKKECQNIFFSLGLNVTFFEAIPGNTVKNVSTKISTGNIGCCMSHYKLWQEIQNKKYENVLIMEDDVEFHHNVAFLFENFYEEVPSDWELLYFGGNHCKEKLNFISEHIHKLKKTYTTHCYALKQKTINYLLNRFNMDNLFKKEIDVNLSEVQNEIPSYGFYPHLAWQRIGFSDIENKHVNYSFLKEQ